MTREQELMDKLRRVEALFARTTFEGERVAAANAMDRIRERLRGLQVSDPPIEFRFTMQNNWSRQLLVALMRRYDIKPYRYHRQRHTTVMARVPASFVDETNYGTNYERTKRIMERIMVFQSPTDWKTLLD